MFLRKADAISPWGWVATTFGGIAIQLLLGGAIIIFFGGPAIQIFVDEVFGFSIEKKIDGIEKK